MGQSQSVLQGVDTSVLELKPKRGTEAFAHAIIDKLQRSESDLLQWWLSTDSFPRMERLLSSCQDVARSMKPDFSDDPLKGYYIDTYYNIVGHAPQYGWAIGHRATDCCILYGFMEKEDAQRALTQMFKWFDLMDQQQKRIGELEAKLKLTGL